MENECQGKKFKTNTQGFLPTQYKKSLTSIRGSQVVESMVWLGIVGILLSTQVWVGDQYESARRRLYKSFEQRWNR